MSNGFLSKFGRALSIFGVSSPDDVRKMQHRKMPVNNVQPAPSEDPGRNASQPSAPENQDKDK